MTPRKPAPLTLDDLVREEARLGREVEREEKALIRNHLTFDYIGIRDEVRRVAGLRSELKKLQNKIAKKKI